MTNVHTLDFSKLTDFVPNEQENVDTSGIKVNWDKRTTPNEAYVVWSNESIEEGLSMPVDLTEMFMAELKQHCSGLAILRLSPPMISTVTCAWQVHRPFWAWWGAFSNLRTLSLVGMGMDCNMACDLLNGVVTIPANAAQRLAEGCCVSLHHIT